MPASHTPLAARGRARRTRRLLPLVALVLLAVGVTAPGPSDATRSAPSPIVETRPPLTPRWAYEPWVWEDQEHSAEAVRELVAGYRQRGIPVGAVIVDSPWQTNYNTFEFGPDYPDPAGLIRELHADGVKVVLWATGFLNVSSNDGPERGKAGPYDEALAAGYFVDGGKAHEWYKGMGSAIDFFNPEAVAWWHARMDRAFALGADGWKVDAAEHNLLDTVETAAGTRPLREYRDAYYRAFARYVAERSPEALVAARPYAYEATDALGPGGASRNARASPPARPADGGTVFAPVDAVFAGWVGDQSPDWAGLDEALDNILASAERGYAVLGSDIGGYLPGRRSAKLFMRWTQLGALSPLMENGGRGEHRPWKLGDNVLQAYRYYAKLHRQLVPYLYSAGVVAHRTGRPIVREPDRERRQYLLGDDLLVAPIVTAEDERDVTLPAGARWHDYWDDNTVVAGPAQIRHRAAPDRIPLFIRAGATVPMEVADGETGHGSAASAGHLTLLLYPDGDTTRTYHPDAERSVELRSRRDNSSVTVEIGPQTERYLLRIKEASAPVEVTIDRGGGERALPPLPTRDAFDGAVEGWHYDSAGKHLWARFATADTGARLRYGNGS